MEFFENFIQIYKQEYFYSIHFTKCDVTSKDDWAKMWDEAEEVLGGKIEILCNNAGVPPRVG